MKISIIGAGSVGATTAYTLMLKNLASEIVLIDIDKKKAEGEAHDMGDCLPFAETSKIRTGDYSDARDSDIIIHTAGIAQKPGETRLVLADKNKEITKSIFKEIGKLKSSCVVMVIANPVDVITYTVQEISGLPHNQVFGTGTSLDSARLKSAISQQLNLDSKQVEGFLCGEHGDSEFVAWSTVSIEGKPASELLSKEDMKKIEDHVKNEAYEIINLKGATFYGIASVAVDIVEAIVLNQDKIIPVSSRYDKDDEIPKVCFGYPCVIGINGIIKRWEINLTNEEKEKLLKSAEKIHKYI